MTAEKKWIRKPKAKREIVNMLINEVNLPTVIAEMTAARGVESYEQARKYFAPRLNDLHDPFLMRDMNKSVDRVLAALVNKERILVYGDYDVDGTTSVSMMYSFLKAQGADVEYYIPDRYKEGYGISMRGVQKAVDEHFSLMISLDCGIKAVGQIRKAQNGGTDVIVCDHHLPGNELPPAFAVLDPKRADCEYPYKELSGCGVGYKLIEGMCRRNPDLTEKKKPTDFLDLLAVSIACDIVPVTGENRAMLKFGLEKINSNPSKGLQTLLGSDPNKEVTVYSLGFVAGPRINAAGRIEHAHKAVELLTGEEDALIDEGGKLINSHNETRQKLDKKITEEALEMIERDEQLKRSKTTVVFREDWHKGVIGIVASRLIETHYKPTIVFTQSEGKLAGSARSVRDFDIYNALCECEECLEQFGGHKYAAGMTLKPENLEAFKKQFEQVVSSRIRPDQLLPVIEVDAELNFNEIDDRFFRIQNRMQPFGPSNPRPLFTAHRVFDTGYSRVVGKDAAHLKVHLKQPHKPGKPMSGIGFNMAHKLSILQSGKPLSIVFRVEENVFKGMRSLQLNVADIKFTEEVFGG